jgi:hypothetical protein
MKTVNGPNDIPEGHHYAILIFKSTSVYIPGDERSRTNPGHGYPERTESYTTYEMSITHSRDEWVEAIQKLEKEKQDTRFSRASPYAAIEVASKATIETKVIVK